MSGYADWRADLHNRLLPVIQAELARRGYPSDLLRPDGHRPDARFTDGSGYWDLKTGKPNLTIEYPALAEYRRIEHAEGLPVYIIHANVDTHKAWSVDRLSSLATRQIGGSYRQSGIGSNDTGALFRRGGTPFCQSFPHPWELDDALR